ncbi:hypothetical protein [Psychromonas hadalis]|nr:hypothetical protein [Psychromonas hadalis]
MNQKINPRLLVIGGSGETGKRIIDYLNRSYPELHISCAAKLHKCK